jgi:hypothetical protein
MPELGQKTLNVFQAPLISPRSSCLVPSKRTVQKRDTAHEVGKSMPPASPHAANFPSQRFIDGIAAPRL